MADSREPIADCRSPLAGQRWLVLAMLVFLMVLAAVYTSKVAGSNRSAVLRWRPQLQDFGAGKDIYRLHNFPCPPIMALALYPLTLLPPVISALAWFLIKAGLMLLTLRWVFRMVETPGQPFPVWGRWVAVFLCMWPFAGDLTHGNVNLFILFLVAGALYAFCQGKDVLSGVTLGLAIACKVTPALFIPYFIWKRAWKCLGGCLAGLVLFFWLVPGCFLGMTRNAQLLETWTNQMVRPYLLEGQVAYSEHINQSIPGVAARLLTHSPSFSGYLHNRPIALDHHNLLNLDRAVVGWIVKACMLEFVGLVVWCCRTPTRSRKGWCLTAEFSLVVLGMLLFSERTWKHHCVTLILPFSVIMYYLAVCKPGPGMRRYLTGTVVIAFLLIASASIRINKLGLGLGRWEMGELAQVYGPYLWANLLLMAAMVTLLRRGTTPSPACPVYILSATRTVFVVERQSDDSAATGVGHVFNVPESSSAR